MALLTWVLVVLVLCMVLVLVGIEVVGRSNAPTSSGVSPAPAGVVQAVTSVTGTDFDAVGAPAGVGPQAQLLSGKPALTAGGVPAVVFAGAEFSPYSALLRWSLVAALGRFGTFGRLAATRSASTVVFPGTASLSFEEFRYRSSYLFFDPVEQYGATLSARPPAGYLLKHSPGGMAAAALRAYDQATEGGGPTLPFLDVGNFLVMNGADGLASPAVLAGLSISDVASELANPTSAVAAAVLGVANEISAAICSVDGNRPVEVCRSPGVVAGAARLRSG